MQSQTPEALAAKSDRPTQTSTVYECIREHIINGEYPARSKLNTRKLAERFDVGLSPIREALSRLSSEGWVTQTDRRGFSVIAVSVEELWDLHLSRCMLNEVGLRDSIEHGGEDWEERVLLSCIKISRLQRPSDSEFTAEAAHWHQLHRAFHTSLVSACRSQRIVRYCDQVFDELERYRRVGRSFDTKRDNVADEHRAIADASVDRKADLAVELLDAHFTKTVRQVERAIRDMNP